MKIAIVTKGELPVPSVKGGGAETLITALVKENEKSDNEITVYSIYDEKAVEESKKYRNTKFIFLPYRKRTLIDRVRCRLFTDFPRETPISFSKVASDIKKKDFDKIVIEHSPWQFPFFVNKFGNKVSLHLHNDWINSSWKGKYANRFREAINNSAGVITISKYMESRVMTLGGVDRDKVKLLYNATDIKMFGQALSDFEYTNIRKQLGIKRSDTVLIYTGRLCQDKGVLELLEAYKRVSEKNQNIVLLIVGSVSYGETITDEYTQKVSEIVKQYPGKIIMTGFVPYKDVYKYYAISDIQIIPSMWEEPFGLVAIEGMSQGLPIICSDSGGLMEVIDNECGLVVHRDNIIEELRDAIDKLVTDKELQKQLGNEAKKRVESHKEYSYSKFYEDFIELL